MEAGRRKGLSITPLIILATIARGTKPCFTTLADACGISSAALTIAVDRLEQAGLAKRFRTKLDRRKIHVEITELGTETIDQILS